MKAIKGQSALEYMMTYGWGILVVLIAGVLMWQLGFLELGKNVTPDKRGFSQLLPIDWSMQVGGTFTAVIQNNAGTIVDIDDVDANVIAGGTGECDAVTAFSIADVRPGSSQMIEMNCEDELNGEIGEYYRLNMTVTYTNPSSGLVHKSNGVVWGPIG
jgi:hypothetical protein